MQIAWSQRTLQEDSLGRVSRSRPDLVISQAVAPFTNAGPRVARCHSKDTRRSPAQSPNLSGTGEREVIATRRSKIYAIFLRLPRLSAASHAMMGYDGHSLLMAKGMTTDVYPRDNCIAPDIVFLADDGARFGEISEAYYRRYTRPLSRDPQEAEGMTTAESSWPRPEIPEIL